MSSLAEKCHHLYAALLTYVIQAECSGGSTNPLGFVEFLYKGLEKVASLLSNSWRGLSIYAYNTWAGKWSRTCSGRSEPLGAFG